MKTSCSFIPTFVYVAGFEITDPGGITIRSVRKMFEVVCGAVKAEKVINDLAWQDEWPRGMGAITYFNQGIRSPILNMNLEVKGNLISIYISSKRDVSPKLIVQSVKDIFPDSKSIGENLMISGFSERRMVDARG